MADKNLENIEYKFESINNLLEAMRAQNAANAGDVDKVLANINLKLDTISDEENTDLIKVFLAELKRSLEERHNFVSSKFVEMEEAYKQLVEKAGESVKAQDIKQVFDIIATNLNVFSKEVFTQKELLNQINTKMEESKLDDTAKKDILKNISLLKVELEKFNNGFESIILNLGSNFQTMSESLLKLDQSEALADVKKDIENIFLSSNAVLSTLQVIDRKNRELEDVLTQVVTKEDFKIEQDQVAKLVAQNIQLSDYISKLPVNEVVEDLNKKIDTTVGVINALKNILSEATDQNQKMLSAQIENLESKIANISSEEEFIGFRKELSDFAAEVMQSSNLMRADLLDTNSELKKLTAFINSSNLKNDFEEIANTVKASENNLAQNISEASSNFIQSALNNKSELEQNIIQSTRQITEKIDATEKTVSENSKSNLTNILDGIQSVISNIFSAKNEINLSNIENSENVEIKIEELQKDLNASKSALIQNSKKNLEEINTNLQAVINFTNETRTLLEGNVAQNSKLVEEKLEELSKKLTEAQNFIDKNSKESTEKISALNEELIAGLNAFKTESQEGATTTAAWVKQTITELTRELEDTKESLETKSKLNFEGLLAKIQGISQEIKDSKEGLETKSSTNFENLNKNFDEISKEIQGVKENLEEKSNLNFEGLSEKIQEISHSIEQARNLSEEALGEKISKLKDEVSILPLTIKENQQSFTQESKILIEENSKEIENLSTKIQNLIGGLQSKDKPFQEELMEEISGIIKKLEAAKENLSSENAQNLETLTQNFTQIQDGLKISEEKMSNLSTELGRKIDGLLLNLTQMKELSAVKEDENFQKTLEIIDGEFAEMAEKLEELKTSQKSFCEENFINLSQKISEVNQLVSNISEVNFDKSFEDLKTEIQAINTEFIKFSEKIEESPQKVQAAMGIFGDKLLDKIDSLGADLGKNQKDTREKILEKLEDFNPIEKISELKSDLIQNQEDIKASLFERFDENIDVSKDNLDEMISLKNGLLEEIDVMKKDLKDMLKEENEGHITKLKADLQELIDEITKAQEEIASHKLDLSEILKVQDEEAKTQIAELENTIVDEIAHNVEEFKTSVQQTVSQIEEKIAASAQNYNSSLNSLVTEIKDSKEGLETKSSTNFENLNKNFDEISKEIQGVKENLEEKSNLNFEGLSEKIQEISNNIEEARTLSEEAFGEKIAKLKDEISILPLTIKENQNAFAQESKVLIEENSKEIENLSVKIQNLISGIQSKDKPFQNEVLSEISNIIATLEVVKKDLSDESLKALDEIKSEIAQIQKASGENIEEYKVLIENLQTKLEQNLQALDGGLKKSEEKLSDLSSELGRKIDGVLLNITQMRELSAIKEDETFQKTLEVLENEFENLSKTLEEQKTFSKETSDNLLEDISTKMEGLEENISSINDEINVILIQKTNEIKNEFTVIKETLSKFSEIDFEKSFDDLKAKIDYYNSSIKTSLKEELKEENTKVLDELTEKFALMSEKIEILKSDFNTKTTDDAQDLKTVIESVCSDINDLGEIIGQNPQQVENAINSFGDKLLDKIDSLGADLGKNQKDTREKILEKLEDFNPIEKISELKSDLIQNQEDIKASLFERFDENIDVSKDNLDEMISLKNGLLEEIDVMKKDLKDMLKEENEGHITKLKTDLQELIDEITKAQEEIASHKLDLSEILKVRDEEAKTQIAELENTIVDEIAHNVEEFKTSVQQTVNQIEEKIAASAQNYNTSLNSLVTEIKTDFYEKVEANMADLKSFIEVFEDKMNIAETIDELKSEFFERFSLLADDVEEKIGKISIKKDLDKFSQNVESSVKELFGELYDKIMLELENNKLTQDVFSKTEEVARRIEDMKNIVTEEILEKIEHFGLSIEKQSKDFTNLMEEVRVSLYELKESYIDLSLNTSMEISSLLSNVQDKVEKIEESIGTYDFKDIVESSKEELLKDIGQKLDSMSEDTAQTLQEEFKNIKNTIESQHKFFESLKSLERMDEMSLLQEEIKKITAGYESKLNTLAQENPQTKEHLNDIKKEVGELKKGLLESVLSVFDQISFIVEAEDIKDFVEEKSKEINTNIKTSMSGNLNEIKKELNDVKKHIKHLQTSEDEQDFGYSYTLQDIESDIAKVRMILNEITKSTQEVSFDKLNEDIMSISTRTNTILMNSNESYNELKENLNDFKSIVYNLEEKVNFIDSTEIIRAMDKKLDEIKNFTHSSVKSDKIFNQTFMYLAEWVDTAGENLDIINEKVSQIEELKLSIAEAKKYSAKKVDVEMLLEEISEKFDRQQEKIDELESKIEKLFKTRPSNMNEFDIKAIVEEVLAQVGGGKGDAKLSKKVDSIEKQITQLSKNIEKLTSYVD